MLSQPLSIGPVIPLMQNLFSHPYQLEESILGLLGGMFFIFIQILKETSVSEQRRT